MKFYFTRIFPHLFPKQPKTCITFMLLNHFKQWDQNQKFKVQCKNILIIFFHILAEIPESSVIGPAISICLYLTGKAKKKTTRD